MKLKKKRFGGTDYRISELCLSISNFGRYANQDESFAILDSFNNAGGNLIQTSGICPGVNLGDSFMGMPEELLGRWLKQPRSPLRKSLVIGTRIALTRPVIGGLDTFTELIRRSAEDSIRRIGCCYLDFLILEWTEAIAPIQETIAALEAVVATGDARHIILAGFPPWHLREWLSQSKSRLVAGLQLDYSLASRTAFEAGAAKACVDHGLGSITRSPLAGGHLASRRLATNLGALRQRGPSDRHAAVAAEGIWPGLSATARACHRSPAQVALAWVLAQPQVTSTLVSVSSVAHLRELLRATRLRLRRPDLERLGGRSTPRHALAS